MRILAYLTKFLYFKILRVFYDLRFSKVRFNFDVSVRHRETYVRLFAYSTDAQRWAKLHLSEYPQQRGRVTEGTAYEVPHNVYHEIRRTVLWPCPCPFEFADPTFINPVEFFKIGESFRTMRHLEK